MEAKDKTAGKSRSCCRVVVACIVTGILVAGVMLAIFIPVMHYKVRQANKLQDKATTTPAPGKESTTKRLQKAADWLLAQRNSQWGWTKDDFLATADGMIAIKLAKPEWCCQSADSGATVNRMKLDVLNGLLKNSALDVTEWYGGRLGMYVTALFLSCNDPQKFYGHNLTAILRTHMDNFPKYNFNQMFTYSWGVLGLCAANKGNIDQTYVDRLLLGMKEDFTVNSTDTMGMSVQALACVKPRTNKIQNAIKSGIIQIRKKAESDGSFGNPVSTAIAYQALLAADALPDDDEEKRIVDFLFARQGNDGSFSSISEAFQILPALSKKPFSKINTYSEGCESDVPTPKPTSSGTVLRVMIKVKYSIFNNVTSDKRDVTRYFTVPNNSTFFEVMGIAAKEDNRYSFTTKDFSWGHMITSLSGVAASDSDRTFWSVNVAINKAAGVGVDQLRVINEDHVIMQLATY